MTSGGHTRAILDVHRTSKSSPMTRHLGLETFVHRRDLGRLYSVPISAMFLGRG